MGLHRPFYGYRHLGFLLWSHGLWGGGANTFSMSRMSTQSEWASRARRRVVSKKSLLFIFWSTFREENAILRKLDSPNGTKTNFEPQILWRRVMNDQTSVRTAHLMKYMTISRWQVSFLGISLLVHVASIVSGLTLASVILTWADTRSLQPVAWPDPQSG